MIVGRVGYGLKLKNKIHFRNLEIKIDREKQNKILYEILRVWYWMPYFLLKLFTAQQNTWVVFCMERSFNAWNYWSSPDKVFPVNIIVIDFSPLRELCNLIVTLCHIFHLFSRKFFMISLYSYFFYLLHLSYRFLFKLLGFRVFLTSDMSLNVIFLESKFFPCFLKWLRLSWFNLFNCP